MFLKRMKGIVRLFAAILETRPRDVRKSHPLGNAETWRILAAILSLPPRPDISAVVVLEILEVCGNSLIRIYKTQAKKLLHNICVDYVAQLEKVNNGLFHWYELFKESEF